MTTTTSDTSTKMLVNLGDATQAIVIGENDSVTGSIVEANFKHTRNRVAEEQSLRGQQARQQIIDEAYASIKKRNAEGGRTIR